MPYQELMSWDASKKRWHRMHQNKMYRVPASQLGDPPTREATRQAANEWWTKKQAELDRPVPTEVDRLASLMTENTAPEIEAFVSAMPHLQRAENPDRSVQATGEAFLQVIRTTVKPLSFREIRQYVHLLIAQLHPEIDVQILNEDKVEKLYLDLRDSDLSSGVKKKRWGFFRRYVKYLWEKRLIDLPRNLDSHSFEVHASKIKTYTPQEVREVLQSLKPRFRLYALLGLNAGMTSADIGQLRKDQIDLDNSTLTRKRVKTADNANVPVVVYQLWPETLTLIRECWSRHPTLVLTSMDGTPMWESRQEGEKTPQKDLIYQQFKRAKVSISQKSFRSISATLLESHPTYGRYVPHFLGHSPKSIADKHYAAPSDQLFAEALSWLRGQILA